MWGGKLHLCCRWFFVWAESEREMETAKGNVSWKEKWKCTREETFAFDVSPGGVLMHHFAIVQPQKGNDFQGSFSQFLRRTLQKYSQRKIFIVCEGVINIIFFYLEFIEERTLAAKNAKLLPVQTSHSSQPSICMQRSMLGEVAEWKLTWALVQGQRLRFTFAFVWLCTRRVDIVVRSMAIKTQINSVFSTHKIQIHSRVSDQKEENFPCRSILGNFLTVHRVGKVWKQFLCENILPSLSPFIVNLFLFSIGPT